MPVPRSSDRCQAYIDRKVYGPTFHTKPGPCWIVRPSPTELAPEVNSVCRPPRALVWMRYWLQPLAAARLSELQNHAPYSKVKPLIHLFFTCENGWILP